MAAQQDTIAKLGVRTAHCEALLGPLKESPGATNLTNRSSGKNATINTTAPGERVDSLPFDVNREQSLLRQIDLGYEVEAQAPAEG